ncbi:hypothetical protein F5Y16DRAFT_392990 [Xylariaceae sp. FL0255]|nr:hypothetical protein F5Y16DRAFT_392990 [Xylariaceae sp. FL0255]
MNSVINCNFNDAPGRTLASRVIGCDTMTILLGLMSFEMPSPYKAVDALLNYTDVWTPNQMFWMRQRNLSISLQITLRCLSNKDIPALPSDAIDGIPCQRHSSSDKIGGRRFVVSEKRFTVIANITGYGNHGKFVIVALMDIDSDNKSVLFEKVWGRDVQHGLPQHCRLDKPSTVYEQTLSPGIYRYQLVLTETLRRWYMYWDEMLNVFDEAVHIPASNILDQSIREQLMYDNSKLERSELYFAILQLLPLYRSYIQDSMNSLEAFVTKSKEEIRNLELSNLPRSQDPELHLAIRRNWDTILCYMNKNANNLLKRMDQKTEEVQRLRDGLLNASTVLEAIRIAEINRYLFVVTVVAILYILLRTF